MLSCVIYISNAFLYLYFYECFDCFKSSSILIRECSSLSVKFLLLYQRLISLLISISVVFRTLSRMLFIYFVNGYLVLFD